ncbi:filamentous hemagglutinin N-terminal domain-containing protein [Iningainema tapete]|uniref:Filamentous hemagglutinin N-terminal domain-containing protein n=1 Tax=Iningainema tapete BLCC-T55 TaxID=2748662 RepID=A0A8J6XK95_9CYAN|nr:filamentous hemagglutinin N-terminal domain-containing protein [Iningainema tapete]MBD2774477.1 filamentous hemagglutinin N-terminal domain-containing protein [Iningainema tapete BLCC-T55]
MLRISTNGSIGLTAPRIASLFTIAIVVLHSFVCVNCANAQIVPDNTLPSNTIVTPSGNTSIIEGGTRAGSNLFHSFEQFSVPNGSTAYFNNAVDIENIITRVTGSYISHIDGLIRASGSANLFLLNPNGIIFGQGASLNIGGSLSATTAHSLKFADGSRFSTIPTPTQALLTISVPIGLQFGSNQIGNITNAGNLAVREGQNLTLIGSNFTNNGQLSATGGQVTVASVPSQGMASLGQAGEVVSLEDQPTDIIHHSRDLGNTIITGSIDASNPQPGKTGGKVQILGERVTLSDNSQVNVSGDVGGGKVLVGGDYQGQLKVPQATATSIEQQATIKADALTNGNGGQITIWGTESTRAYGSLSARGGIKAGSGGLIETSGGNFIDVADIRDANTSATNGTSGTWLLYSPNITFTKDSSTINGNLNIAPQNRDNAIETQLNAGTNVSIKTSGNITADGLGMTKKTLLPVTLTMQADKDITLKNFGINLNKDYPNSRLNVVLQAGNDGAGKGNVRLTNGGFETKGGGFIATAAGSISLENVGIDSNNTSTIAAEPITITGGSVSIRNSGINSKTSGDSNAGLVSINANSLNLQNVGINSKTIGNGNSTGININVNSLSVKDGNIGSQTRGNGNAGNVNINANSVELEQAGLESITTGDGNAGNVTVTAKTFSLLNKGGITTTAYGDVTSKGNAGAINVTADNIFISNSGFNSGTIGEGNAGSITIKTGSFKMEDGSGVGSDTGIDRSKENITTINNKGNAGSLDITADLIELQEKSGITSETGGRGNAGKINLKASTLILRNNSNIDTNTLPNSTGNAGFVEVNANSVLFENNTSGLGSNTTGFGKAGAIIFNADNVVLRNKAVIGTDTKGEGSAGQLTLTASSLKLENDSKIISDTNGSENGGNLILQIKGGLTLSDRSSISVSSTTGVNGRKLGRAGDIEVRAGSILLDNQSAIRGEAGSADGGNINLQIRDLLLLRRHSQISTNAGNGNGGNITINTPSGFIVAVPKENSDITSNAIEGKGGFIDITASGVLGLEIRKQQQTVVSDITAFSAQNPSLNGTIQINTPDVDPSRGLVELPISLVDASKLIDTSCNLGSKQRASSFVFTGRGGLPSSPINLLAPDATVVEWVSLPNSGINQEQSNTGEIPHKLDYIKPQNNIVEASSWVVDADGNVVLVATAPTVMPGSPSCSKKS